MSKVSLGIYEGVIVPVAVLIFALSLYLIFAMVEVRGIELRYQIKSLNSSIGADHATSLLIRFENELGLSKTPGKLQDQDFLGEQKALVATMPVLGELKKMKFSEGNLMHITAFKVMNFVNRISYIDALPGVYANRYNHFLDLAWILERKRHFKDALKIYRQIDPYLNNDDDSYFFVLLHSGYCSFFLGEFEESRCSISKCCRSHW